MLVYVAASGGSMSAASQENGNADLFDQALALHQTGNVSAAELIYQRVVAARPNHAHALHSLAAIAYHRAQHSDAEALVRRAIAASPREAVFHHTLAQVLRARGNGAGATRALETAVSHNPEFVAAWQTLAAIHDSLGESKEAAHARRRVSELRDRTADEHNRKGIALVKKRRLQEACVEFRSGIQCNPDAPGLYHNLGNTLFALGRHSDAIACLRQASRLAPNWAEAHASLGKALPAAARQHASRGNSLWTEGRFEEAALEFRRAIDIGSGSPPEMAEFWRRLAVASALSGDTRTALPAFDTALSINPESYRARTERALVLLKVGNFKEGWREYEWRFRLPQWKGKRVVGVPRWEGESVDGKTIVLLGEQGLGDSIQFVRYGPMLAKQGARVVVACDVALKRLFRSIDGIDAAYGSDDGLIKADFQCELMSLPLRFGTTVDSIPDTTPYITPDAAAAADWSRRLGARERFRVGLVWAGRCLPPVDVDQRRSFTLDTYRSLADVPDVEFHSLQKGVAVDGSEFPIVDFPSGVDDLWALVPLVENLDLIICADTAVAHLAGAMGKPVWVLSRYDACWRWFFDRADTPWYRTMRLFRQPRPGDWQSVIRDVKKELQICVVNWKAHRPEAAL